MSRNRQKLLPHPALLPSAGSDYLPECQYGAEVKAIRIDDRREIYIAMEHRLECASLKRLTGEGQAEFMTLADCNRTKRRAAFRSAGTGQTIKLDKTEFRGKIRISSYIYAAAEIKNHLAEDWLPETRQMLPEGIDLPKGAILAQSPETSFNPDDQEEQESIMSIVPKDGLDPGKFQVELDEDRIIVRVSPDTRAGIDLARKSEGWNEAMWSPYLTVMVEAIRQHQEDEHIGKRWASRIRKALRNKGIDPADAKENPLEHAQTIMENPLNKLLHAAAAQQKQDSDD